MHTDYFQECKTIHEAKSRFRELCKKHHPDVGGNAKVMAEIVRQHDAFTPKQPEHSNFFGSGNYNSAFFKTNPFRNTFQEERGFNFMGSIPFDHPIHQEIRQLKNAIRSLETDNSSFKSQVVELRKTYEFKRAEMDELRKCLSEQELIIDDLEKQLEEERSNKMPLYKIILKWMRKNEK